MLDNGLVLCNLNLLSSLCLDLSLLERQEGSACVFRKLGNTRGIDGAIEALLAHYYLAEFVES